MSTWKKEFLHWITLKPIIKTNLNDTLFEFRKDGELHNIDFPAYFSKYNETNILKTIGYMEHGNGICKAFYTSGNIGSITYHKNYKLHKDLNVTLEEAFDSKNSNGAAEIRYYDNGNIMSKKFILNGKYVINNMRNLIPYAISFHRNGKIAHIFYGFRNFLDIPPVMNCTYIEYYESGIVKFKELGIKTEKGESVIFRKSYYDYGTNKKEEYINNGLWHNPEDSIPAIIKYYPDGAVKSMEFYLQGKPDRIDKNLPIYIKFYESGAKKEEKYGASENMSGEYIRKIIMYYEDGRIRFSSTLSAQISQ